MDQVDLYLVEKSGEDEWSAATQERYRRALVQFIEEVKEPEKLDKSGFSTWLNSHGWGSSARYVAYIAVRGYLRWKFGKRHPALKLKVKRKAGPPQRTLDLAQVRKLLESFDTQTPKGRRDLAIATLMLDTGLRVSEVCNLELRYLELEHMRLAVVVKGGQWAGAVYSDYTASCIASWLADREAIARPGVKTVFVSVGGNLVGRSLTRNGFQRIVKYWGQSAGIGMLSPHDFRRTFATLATRAGAPERVLMAAGRWSSSEMVKRYTQAIKPEDMAPYSPVLAALK
jgi:integrase